MAVYYKFKSARDYDSLPIDGHFISVGNLKERIFESKHLGRGKDFDLMVSNAQTNEEYADEATLIPRNTSVLIRRIPGCPRKPIVTQPDEPKVVEDKIEETQLDSGAVNLDSSAMKFPESEWDEFGNDLYAVPEVPSVQSSNTIANFAPPTIADEDSKIKALVDTPALDWQQAQDNYGPGRGYGRGMGGRNMSGRGFGRGGPSGFERKTPPPGYICHRCKVPGHFIQHCPTNGDPNYDIRRVKPPTGIPKSMLVATNDGSYALSTGVVAVMKPNEAAFEKEIEGLPSTRPVTDFPPELHCPLCKEVMKDAVLTSKCCFSSFCDKCIRDHIISKSMCTCGATNVLADDLLPNKTLRDTINRIMESTSTSSADNAGSFLQAPDMESTRPLPPRDPSPTLSATKGESILPPLDSSFNKNEDVNEKEGKQAAVTTQSEDRVVRGTTFSKATSESLRAKPPTSQESAPAPASAPVEESQEKPVSSEPGKKKKKKKTRLPIGVSDMQWQPFHEIGAESCGGMPFMPPAFNPYVSSMPWGMDGYIVPFPATVPMVGYPQGPFDAPFGGVLPHDPFGVQGYMMPPFPQRDLAEMTMGGFNMNSVPPMMNKEFEARKANIKKKSEIGKQSEREHSKDGGSNRGMSYSTENAPPRPKLVSELDRPRRVRSPDRRGASSSRDISRRRHTPTPPPPPPPLEKEVKLRSKREESRPTSDAKPDDKKHKASVFSRISFPSSEEEEKKKRKNNKATPSSEASSNGVVVLKDSSREKSDRRPGKGSSSVEYDSSEECHFKRRKASSPSERHEHDREGRSSKRRR